MADNKIKVGYELNDNGSVEKLKKKTDAAAQSTDNLNKKKNYYNKQEKGAAGITSNSTKAFAKQAQTIGGGGGLVAAYATLAANIFAITAAFGVLQRAAAVEQLEKGLIFTGRAAGQNLPMVVDRLRDITDGALAASDAMASVAVGVSAGFSQGQLEGLTKVARGASLALGRDMTDAMNRLVRGAAKLEPEILDELGIMVRLDETTQKYAASMGKSANSLTQFEKRMAFTNAIIEQGSVKFGALSQVIEANPYDRLAASFDGLTKTVLNFFNTALKPLANFFADNIVAVVGVFGSLAATTINSLLPALTGAGKRMAELATASAETAKSNIANVKSFAGAPKEYVKLTKAIQDGTASEKDMQKAKNSLTRSVRMHNIQMESFVERHKEGSAAVTEKRAKLASAEKALKNIALAENEATVATQLNTRANALNAAALGDIRGMLSALKLAWVTELAATNANTAGKTLLTRALAFLRTGFSLAALSVKAFGIALLQAIPVIGQLIMVGTIAYSMLKDFFVKPPDALDKELERVGERLAEFPKIVDQMTVAFIGATTKAEAFHAALNPTTGLVSQINDQMQSLVRVQKADLLASSSKKQVEITKKRIKLTALLAKHGKEVTKEATAAEKILARGSRSSMGGFGAGPDKKAAESVASKKEYQAAQVEIAALEQELSALGETGIDFARTQQGAIDVLSTGIATFTQMKEITKDNEEAQTLFANRLAESKTILASIISAETEEDLVKALDAFSKLNIVQQNLQNSSDAAAAAVTKVTDRIAKAGKRSGVFAKDIEDLGENLGLMANAGDTASIIAKYEEVFKAYGVAAGDVTNLTKVFEELKSINLDSILLPLKNAKLEEQARTQILAGQKLLGLQTQLEALKNTRELAARKAESIQNLATATEVEKQQAKLDYLKAQTDEMKKQEEIRKGEVANAGRLMGGSMGAMEDMFGMMKRDKSKMIATTQVNSTELNGPFAGMTHFGEKKENFNFTAESMQTVNQAMQPMLENLASLGPEGELMSSLSQSGLMLAETFAGAFDKISEGQFNMVDGIGVAASAITALGAIQSAQGKAAVANIDKQIEAEKKRDGKSKESLAKIAGMEKKKEQMERKNFERDKKMKMAQAVSSTAVGIMKAYEQGGMLGFITGSLIAAIGAMQLSAISSTSFDGGGSSSPTGPTKISVGNRQNTVDLAKSKSPAGELGYMRGDRGMGGMSNFTPAFTGAKYRAAGGNTAFMVGEQGPELFVPERPGTIVPADETAGGVGAPVNVSFNISAVDNRGVEDLLTNQRGYIIGMIREAANAHGETFLEQVDERAYEMEK